MYIRKFISFLSVFILFFTVILSTTSQTSAAEINLAAESAILVDAGSGKILYQKNEKVLLPPASMVKIMTEYLVLEAVAEGRISWDTTTKISDYVFSISANNNFSGIGLRKGVDYSVKDLYDAMAIYSDNGTTIALAELIAGSEGEFVKMMNEKGKEIRLPEYKFVNSTGLSNTDLGDNYPSGTQPNDENLLSARSLALLAYHVINEYPELLETSSITVKSFEGHEMINWNWMLPGMPGYLDQFGYQGVDGLKTGWTDLAGFCFTGTAKRGDMRLISVVMRTESKEARFNETKKLLDYGFSNFEMKELFPADYQIEGQSILPVVKGKEDQVQIATKTPIQRMIKFGEEELYQPKYVLDESLLTEKGELEAPVEKGQIVGQMILEYSGEEEYGYINMIDSDKDKTEIQTIDSVEKANWFILMLRGITGFFGDIWNSVSSTVKGWL